MNKFLLGLLIGLFIFNSNLFSSEKKGLNIVVTSGNAQTQKMAMVLSMMTLYQGKNVNMTLCSDAANLAIKETKNLTENLNQSPKALLKAIVKKGADVKVCKFDLNSKKNSFVLLDGVVKIDSKNLLSKFDKKGYQVLSYLE